MTETVLETKDLRFLYTKSNKKQVYAVDNVSIKIGKGELIGIIGHTGSGKSTLIQHFNGILAPTSGTVFLHNEDIWADKKKLRDVRFKVGICFQYPEYQLFEESIYKDIAFGPKNMGKTEEEIDKIVHEVISYVGLDESYLEKSPFDISGGEKRRVAIAGVMAMRPEVLVLDEPCAGLDPCGRNMLLDMIKSYRQTTGSTVVIVSHSMEDMSKLCDKIIVMNNGNVAYYDTVDEVFSHAEELENMGLNIPQITRLFLNLKAKGFNVRTNIYTVEEAKQEILSILK